MNQYLGQFLFYRPETSPNLHPKSTSGLFFPIPHPLDRHGPSSRKEIINHLISKALSLRFSLTCAGLTQRDPFLLEDFFLQVSSLRERQNPRFSSPPSHHS